MIALCHVNNMLIVGRPKWGKYIKREIRKKFKIKELGLLQKHLRIKFNWIKKNKKKYNFGSLHEQYG